MQQFFGKGNGGVCKCAILLENLISIRISRRAPGQHMLIGVGGDPFSFSEDLAILAATCFLEVTVPDHEKPGSRCRLSKAHN